jgi:hypothetical protein
MPIEREDLEAIFADLEARMKVAQEESIQKAVEEARPAASLPPTIAIPAANRRRRIVMVVIVVGSLIMVDHVFAIAAIMRGSEMFIGAFFSWWFDEAKAGLISVQLKKIQLSKLKDIDLQKLRPKVGRKIVPPSAVAPKEEEKETVTEEKE